MSLPQVSFFCFCSVFPCYRLFLLDSSFLGVEHREAHWKLCVCGWDLFTGGPHWCLKKLSCWDPLPQPPMTISEVFFPGQLANFQVIFWLPACRMCYMTRFRDEQRRWARVWHWCADLHSQYSQLMSPGPELLWFSAESKPVVFDDNKVITLTSRVCFSHALGKEIGGWGVELTALNVDCQWVLLFFCPRCPDWYSEVSLTFPGFSFLAQVTWVFYHVLPAEFRFLLSPLSQLLFIYFLLSKFWLISQAWSLLFY